MNGALNTLIEYKENSRSWYSILLGEPRAILKTKWILVFDLGSCCRFRSLAYAASLAFGLQFECNFGDPTDS